MSSGGPDDQTGPAANSPPARVRSSAHGQTEVPTALICPPFQPLRTLIAERPRLCHHPWQHYTDRPLPMRCDPRDRKQCRPAADRILGRRPVALSMRAGSDIDPHDKTAIKERGQGLTQHRGELRRDQQFQRGFAFAIQRERRALGKGSLKEQRKCGSDRPRLGNRLDIPRQDRPCQGIGSFCAF